MNGQSGAPPTPVLQDQLWREVQRVALAMLGWRAERASAAALAGPRQWTRSIEVAGERYLLHGESGAGGSTVHLVIVLAEPRHPAPVWQAELAQRYRLTRTEARVALLLANRYTNREIALTLGVTEHTARRHTEKILLKLGVHRRAAIRAALLKVGDRVEEDA